MFSSEDYVNEEKTSDAESEKESEDEQQLNIEGVGPIEIEEPYNIMWNANDWPVYIRCPFYSENNNLALIIQEGWLLRRPQIIVSFISHFNILHWDNELQLSHFKLGLIKAASAARMWIITNGIDVGISKIIAEAIENEKKWIKAMAKKSPLLQAKCIGVVREDHITSDPLMQRNLKDIEKLNETNPLHQGRDKYKEGKFYIDPHHTHFIFVISEDESDLEQLLALDLFSELSHEAAWVKPTAIKTVEQRKLIRALESSKTPLIAIVIEGDYNSAIVVLQYLQKPLPVVVLQGSGGFADLLAYVYQEVRERQTQEGRWDKNFVEDILKPTLAVKICNVFPEFNDKLLETRNFRDKIVECIKEGTQDGIEYLTILDTSSPNISLTKLDSYLLQAYFKTRQAIEPTLMSKSPQEQFTSDLHLTVVWNDHSMAQNLLKRKASERLIIEKEVFLHALIESDREQFIDMFLDAGFHVRQLYNYSTLRWLILQALKTEFFQVVCCEGILGISVIAGFPFNDILNYLNRLISRTTNLGNFLQNDDLTYRYKAKPNCIEQKALAFFTMWAVFVNNLNLVNKLWPHHNQPINLCLMVSTMLIKMSKFVNDISLQVQMMETSEKYGALAVKLLDTIYEVAPERAGEMITIQSPHWSYQSAIDVAACCVLYNFLAHPSCQKWLSNLYLNNMHVKRSPYGEVITFPDGIKILLCAFLIKRASKLSLVSVSIEREVKKATDLDHKQYGEEVPQDERQQKNLVVDISLPQKLFIVWSAAVTKYWLNHLSYILFLSLFTWSVTVPACGNRILDYCVFIWLTANLAEDVRRTYVGLKKYISILTSFKYLEIFSLIIFLTIFYLGRLIAFEPVARLKLMSINDFAQFMFISLPFMVAAAFIITVSHFPDADFFDPFMLHISFHRTFFAIFRTYDDYLLPNPVCSEEHSYPHRNRTFCRTGKYSDPIKCNLYGFWPYFFNLMYYILIRMILGTLLAALFNTSLALLDEQTIWKFQRFHSIIAFNLNTSLPPPLNILNYIYSLFKYVSSICCNCRQKMKPTASNAVLSECNCCPDSTSIHFMRIICLKVIEKENEEKNINETLSKLRAHSNFTMDYIENTKSQISNLRSTMNGLQRMVYNMQVDVEASKHKIEKEIESFQILSRTSPYPGTKLERFPVSDQFVDWEISWVYYDPCVYTKPKNTFADKDNVDDDYVTEISDKHLSPRLKPQFVFNATCTVENKRIFDRRSWITDANNKQIEYKLDGVLPLNPYGRTGLAGKGSLAYWGPNHFIYVVVTKYSSNQHYLDALLIPVQSENSAKYDLIGGLIHRDNVYDIIRQQLDPNEKYTWTNEKDLIRFFERQIDVDKVKHEKTIAEGLSTDNIPPPVMLSKNVPLIDFELDVEESFKPAKPSLAKINYQKGLQYHKVYKGYMDSPFNTDNAWKEVEFWHFHYTTEDYLKTKMENLVWITVKEDLFEKMLSNEYTVISNCLLNLQKISRNE
ncbi:protein ced-11-like protein [Dinothrombium tinctorium]|uniref:Protein ced-11-like protein n=1 Tax=Dinothrombium tinctorium TaxID=1965070 RepID=A0A3S3P6E2_9ACAR|nr:protein ced-11-like protein [Dinothrombium tinctorium]